LPGTNINCTCSGRLGKSDHEIILFDILIKKLSHNKNCREILNWKKANYDAMKEFLYGYKWAMNADSEINSDWIEFKIGMHRILFLPDIRCIPSFNIGETEVNLGFRCLRTPPLWWIVYETSKR
jgi:hypothetical protein